MITAALLSLYRVIAMSFPILYHALYVQYVLRTTTDTKVVVCSLSNTSNTGNVLDYMLRNNPFQ